MNTVIKELKIMGNEWSTQNEDLTAAAAIINRHIELNDGEPLGLIEVVVDKAKEKPVEVRVPEWIRDLLLYFREQYGFEEGQVVTSKVITRFLLKDETIH
jgi:hypothetical protein